MVHFGSGKSGMSIGSAHATMSQTDVVVVGGGFAGLATAVALSGAGAEVTVVEALEGANPSFRGELIHPPGVRLLEALGLKEALLEAGAVPVHGFAAFSSRDAEPILLPYPSNAGVGLGIEHASIVAAFRHELSGRPRVKIVTRAKIEELLYVDRRVIGVRASDGREFRARIVVAADGRHSRVRKLVGIPTSSTLLSYSVAVSLEGDVLPEPGYGHVLVGAPGPILAYPYGERRIRMCIDVPLGATKGKDKLVGYLRDHYAPHLPESIGRAMLVALGASPLGGAANHAIYTKACAVPGAALVGDAGGCSHPITATGMTTGLHDITTLAECLSTYGPTDDGLVEYQRRRYRFVRAREAFTHSLYGVLRGEGTGASTLREGVFRYWQRSPRAREASMSVLSGDRAGVTTFVAEYVRVLLASAGLACGAALADRDGRAALDRLSSVISTAGDGIRVTLEKASSTLSLERTSVLDYPVGASTGASDAGAASDFASNPPSPPSAAFSSVPASASRAAPSPMDAPSNSTSV
jgi:2-polyprenyl-6-methoxyphenol hydroxylase-like FAD-dependent oxidoreductase